MFPLSKLLLLVNLCETRWVESHEAIIRFSDMLIPIVQFLEDMTVKGTLHTQFLSTNT